MGELILFPVPPGSPNYLEALLARAQKGDEEAFAEIRRHCRALEQKVRFLESQQEEAVAVVQTLMDLYEA